jgi:hypothetical protein
MGTDMTDFLQGFVSVVDYRARTRRIRQQFSTHAGIAVRVMEEIRSFLVLPPDQSVIVQDLMGCRGAFHISEQTIMVDPKQTTEDFVTTLCHECIHAEQYFTRRFSLTWDQTTGNVFLLFDGVQYQSSTYAFNRTEYYDYPWEVEAYLRQGNLSVQVMERLGL